MNDEKLILEHCTKEFAESWKHVDAVRPLLGGFVDAFVVVRFEQDCTATVALEGPGFAKLFGPINADVVPNFMIRADRQDRDRLVSACVKAKIGAAPSCVDVSWNAGEGSHKNDEDNFFNTMTIVECVGEIDTAKLVYFAFQDVSERRMAEHGLALLRFQSALSALFDEIFMLNLDTGTSEPVYAGGGPLVKDDGTFIECGFHTMFRSIHSDDVQLFWRYSNYSFVERELFGTNPADSITFDMRRSDDEGEYHWTRVYISRIASADSRKLVLVCSQNIDEQKDAQRRERELRCKAQHDALTGIYNHGTSEELIRAKLQSLKADETAVFAIVDVDNFKHVNDTYGHAQGDEVLKIVANSVREVCRDDDIVGRIGGDEFVVLFAGDGTPSRNRLQARLERCKEQVGKETAELGIDPPVTLSIGVTISKVGNNAYKEVFDRADKLLYKVKRSGKDALCIE